MTPIKAAYKYAHHQRGSTGIRTLRRLHAISRSGMDARHKVLGDADTAVGTMYQVEVQHVEGAVTPLADHVASAEVNDTVRGHQLAIEASAAETQLPGWDGYGGLPISTKAVEDALAFARLLPEAFPEPEIGPSPRGAVTFDWFVAPDRNLGVSIGPGTVITWSGLLGTEGLHGEVAKPIEAFPQSIETALQLLYSEQNASV